MAKTVWGEARGEPELGQIAVAWVILNRSRTRKQTIRQVCLAPKQFSCWNANDPNHAKLLALKPEQYQRQITICGRVCNQECPDPTDGATHYHAHGIIPRWAQGHTPSAIIGNHVFYNTVR